MISRISHRRHVEGNERHCEPFEPAVGVASRLKNLSGYSLAVRSREDNAGNTFFTEAGMLASRHVSAAGQPA